MYFREKCCLSGFSALAEIRAYIDIRSRKVRAADVFEDASTTYSVIEGAADLVLEGLQRVRIELEGEADLAEETGAILREASENLANLRRLHRVLEKLEELARNSDRRVERLLSEERVIYPETEFGISTFEKLAPHESLMPFEKENVAKTAKLDEEVLC
jgi:hypothetical protein